MFLLNTLLSFMSAMNSVTAHLHAEGTLLQASFKPGNIWIIVF